MLCCDISGLLTHIHQIYLFNMDIHLVLGFCLFVMLASVPASEAAGALCNPNCTLTGSIGETYTRDEIDAFCSDWDTVKTCVQQHEAATGCTPSDDWVNTPATYDYLCTSESRQAYVDHGPCLLNHIGMIPDQTRCSTGSNITCRSLSEYLQCLERTVRVCGFFAARFYSTAVSKSYTSYITSNGCTPYEDEERQCDDDACRVPDFVADFTTEHINAFCSDWEITKTCQRDQSSVTGCTPSDGWINAVAFYDYICTSEGRQAFVDHGPCVANVTGMIISSEKCRFNSDFTCRSLSEYLQCLERNVRVCGFFAARFYSTAVSKQYTSYITSNGCTPYDDEERQCDDDACRVPDLAGNFTTEHINAFCSDWEITKACQRDQSSATGCNPTEGWTNTEASYTYLCTPEGRQAFVDHGACLSNDTGMVVFNKECKFDFDFTCSEMHDALACFEDTYSRACGEEAARVYTTFTSKSHTSFFRSKSCMPYGNSRPTTTPDSAATAMSVTLVTVPAAVITWSITIWM